MNGSFYKHIKLESEVLLRDNKNIQQQNITSSENKTRDFWIFNLMLSFLS